MLAPGQGVVARTAEAVADAREIASAKRVVERALRAAGLSVRLACATVARMSHADLMAEAERVRASSEPAGDVALASSGRNPALKEIST